MTIATDTTTGPETGAPPAKPWAFALWLIFAGIIGELAAFALTLEKLEKLANPDAIVGCDFSVLVQCSANLDSWQGQIFGFPNPIIGLLAWMAPIVVGVSLLAGARFSRWYWLAFNLGMLGALAFVIWLISHSIYNLGTLCPWCMVTWSVTIPSFFVVTFRNLARGVYGGGENTRAWGRRLQTWVVPITIACFVVVALVAQIELDAFNRLW